MTVLRRTLLEHRLLAAALLGASLLLRVPVPAGFMPVTGSDGRITVQICSGMQSGPMTMAMPDHGLPAGQGGHHQPVKAEMPCAFAGLAMPMLSGTDTLLLAVAIAFVMALAGRLVPPMSPRRTHYLRPPLRGPPAAA